MRKEAPRRAAGRLSLALVVGLLVMLARPTGAASPVSPMQRWLEEVQSEARHGHDAEALRMYRKLLPDWSHSAQLFAAMGEAELGLDRGAEAVESYHTAVRLDPKDARVRLGLARALAAQGQREEARRETEEVNCLASRFEPGYLLRSQLLRELGRPTEARPVVQRIFTFRQGSVEAEVELAQILLALGRPADAPAPAQRAGAMRSRWSVSHQVLGLAYRDLGDLPRARHELQAAAQLAPGGPALPGGRPRWEGLSRPAGTGHRRSPAREIAPWVSVGTEHGPTVGGPD